MLKKILMLMVVTMISGAVFAAGEHSASGTVNAVKTAEGKLNISHGPIKSMNMEGMTMDFKVADPAMLDDVNAGSTIDFTLAKDDKGGLVITDLEVTGASTAKAADGHSHTH